MQITEYYCTSLGMVMILSEAQYHHHPQRSAIIFSDLLDTSYNSACTHTPATHAGVHAHAPTHPCTCTGVLLS